MKKTKKVIKPTAKQVAKKSKSPMPTWAKVVNWVVLVACLAFGLLMMSSALSMLSNAAETSSNEDLKYSMLLMSAFFFATMGMAFYSSVKLYNKNITGYIGFFLILIFFAIYTGLIGGLAMSSSGSSLADSTPVSISTPSFMTYICAIPAILLFFVFILMLKYLKPFTKQDIIIIALYILFFLVIAPLNMSTMVEYANKILNIN
jgi:cell division protein FtsW (lipid II flippase)